MRALRAIVLLALALVLASLAGWAMRGSELSAPAAVAAAACLLLATTPPSQRAKP
jgi:hypothetical protein